MAASIAKNLTAILAASSSPLPPGFDSYPVEHFGDIPVPTTCFNQGPGQVHAWMAVLAKVFCDQVGKVDWEFDYFRYNTATGYWNPNSQWYYPGYETYPETLSALGGWFSQYPQHALLQVGLTPSRIDALTMGTEECMQSFSVIINGCNTNALDGKQGGQLMLGQDAFWGTDELYYTLDTNYEGQPPNDYFVNLGANDTSFDMTAKVMHEALHGCGSGCM